MTRVSLRVCARVCVRACVRACVCVCVCEFSVTLCTWLYGCEAAKKNFCGRNFIGFMDYSHCSINSQYSFHTHIFNPSWETSDHYWSYARFCLCQPSKSNFAGSLFIWKAEVTLAVVIKQSLNNWQWKTLMMSPSLTNVSNFVYIS